jgi:hypothetical protein
MDVSDMLDVIHYFFEDDYRYSTNEESIYKDEFRKSFYSQMYSYKYKYSSEDSQGRDSYRDFDVEAPESLTEVEEVIEPFSPRERKASKAFIEATPMVGDEIKPFGSILDGPIS